MSKRLTAVNTNLLLDPDWGNTAITADKAVKVDVTPRNTIGGGWSFFLLLPKTDDDHEFKILLQQVIESNLTPGDRYIVSEIGEDDVKDFESDSACILSFDPNDDSEYIWLNPPKRLKH